MIHYGVTKIAQVGRARGLAETTTGTGVTVNSVLALVAFVASPVSSATNGAALQADGGVVRAVL